MQCTIKGAMPTGKTDPKFGTEFYVQFNEMADTAKLWFQKAPEVGSPLELEKGKYGWKKVKKEWTSNPTTPAATTQSVPSATRPAFNQDGMRQGMCINNASNYVNTLMFEKALTDREWATMVHSYATALYVLGDLKDEAKEAESVTDLYGN